MMMGSTSEPRERNRSIDLIITQTPVSPISGSRHAKHPMQSNPMQNNPSNSHGHGNAQRASPDAQPTLHPNRLSPNSPPNSTHSSITQRCRTKRCRNRAKQASKKAS
ncbi:hypothetical protein VTK26DRAFT_5390 [Humicola hyalothermophila]